MEAGTSRIGLGGTMTSVSHSDTKDWRDEWVFDQVIAQGHAEGQWRDCTIQGLPDFQVMALLA